MRPLSIVAALQYYLPHRTGYTLHVQRVAEALVARGHRVTVLTARHHRDLRRREVVAGVDVLRLDAPLRLSRGALMPGYPLAAWRLARDADVVWANSPMAELGLWAAIARRTGTRFVVTHHGDLHLPDGAMNRLIERMTFAGWRYAARREHGASQASPERQTPRCERRGAVQPEAFAAAQYLATTGPFPTGALPTVVQPATLTSVRMAAMAMMDFFMCSPCDLTHRPYANG